MNKTLFVFGCSYSQNFEDNNIDNYKKYKVHRGGEFPLTWSQLLAKKLNCDLKNYGQGGTGNQSIFRKFCEHAHEFRENDLVIVQWSHMHRHDWANPYDDNFFTVGVGKIPHEHMLTNRTHEEIIMNRTLKAYYNEIYKFMNLIDCYAEAKKFDLFFWDGDNEILYQNEDLIKKYKNKIINGCECFKTKTTLYGKIFNLGGKTIVQETNGVIDDGHLGEIGHKIQSEIFYEHITNPNLDCINDLLGNQ